MNYSSRDESVRSTSIRNKGGGEIEGLEMIVDNEAYTVIL
jgi:hypothetical protein